MDDLGKGLIIVMWMMILSFVVGTFAYRHGVHVGSLEVLASRGCHTDFECEVLVEGE